MTSRFRGQRLSPLGEVATDTLARASLGSAAAVLAAMILATLVAPRSALAGWPPFGRAVVTAPNDQTSPVIAGDGAGGAIVAWTDLRDGTASIFAGRVLASGDLDPAWPLDGRALRTDPLALGDVPQAPALPVIASDGAGGAIVAWQEGRTLANGLDIFAQHVLASGAVDPAWPPNGTALCSIPGGQNFQAIASDGAGGAIVTWTDGRPGASAVDAYAQHVLASGAVDPAWPVNGVAVSTAPDLQILPTIVEDGTGGAIITWTDGRNALSGLDVYAQHLLGSGVVDPAWPVNGRALCTAIGDQFSSKVDDDAAHGAVVTWQDNRFSGFNRVFTQRVLASGVVDPAWPVNGRGLDTPATGEESPTLVSDGSGGAIVTWIGRVDGVANPYAQHIMPTGAVDPAWPAGGRALSLMDFEKGRPVIGSDGAGGAIVAWQVQVDILAQHVLASGALNPDYPANGRVLCGLPSTQREPVMVATGAGGAIVAWTDTRNGTGSDVFALQVLAGGTTDVPVPAPGEISFAPPSPNPARESLRLRFALPRESEVRLAIYDLSGRRVRELVSGTKPAGSHAVDWDLRDERGEAVRAGVYFARFGVDGRTAVQKFMRLE